MTLEEAVDQLLADVDLNSIPQFVDELTKRMIAVKAARNAQGHLLNRANAMARAIDAYREMPPVPDMTKWNALCLARDRFGPIYQPE